MTSEKHFELVDHLFRQEHGKMVAVLTRIFGFRQLELVEDVVQDAFASALRAWRHAIPENPRGWLMQTAKNRAIDHLRRGKLEITSVNHLDPAAVAVSVNDLFHDREIADSQLRLIFACCHPMLEERDQIAFTLQLASGFSVREISLALMTNLETTKKRLQRARRKIKDRNERLSIPTGPELTVRIQSVLKVLYLTFNEGYFSTGSQDVIRRDLCAEAMRLTKLVCENDRTNTTDSNALLALMLFHSARFDSRTSDEGDIVLLRNQDRSKWDRELANVGNYYLARTDDDNGNSEYLIEAAIAAQHFFAPSYPKTNWRLLVTLYTSLYRLKPTPLVYLNLIVVTSQAGDPKWSLGQLEKLSEDDFVGHEHLFNSACAEIYSSVQMTDEAKRHLDRALEFVPNEAQRKVIRAKLQSEISGQKLLLSEDSLRVLPNKPS